MTDYQLDEQPLGMEGIVDDFGSNCVTCGQLTGADGEIYRGRGPFCIICYEQEFELDMQAASLKIKVGDMWVPVGWDTFRSYAGERRMDGQPFEGPVYYLGTDKVYHAEVQ